MSTKFTLSIANLTIEATVDDGASAPDAVVAALQAYLATHLPLPTPTLPAAPPAAPPRPLRYKKRTNGRTAPAPAATSASASTTIEAPPPAASQAPVIPDHNQPSTTVAPAATNGHHAGSAAVALAPERLNYKRMDFHEFDSLVRAEMERLALEPGVMPSVERWDGGRDAALPTFGTVCARYGCESARSLADKLGMRSPKSGPKPANGAAEAL